MPNGSTFWCTQDKLEALQSPLEKIRPRVYYTSKRPTDEDIRPIRVKCSFEDNTLSERSVIAPNTVKRRRPDSQSDLQEARKKMARVTNLYTVQNKILEGKCKMLEFKHRILHERAQHEMERMKYVFKLQLAGRNRRIKELIHQVKQLEKSLNIACNGGVRTVLV